MEDQAVADIVEHDVVIQHGAQAQDDPGRQGGFHDRELRHGFALAIHIKSAGDQRISHPAPGTDVEKKWVEAICDERLEKYYQRISKNKEV